MIKRLITGAILLSVLVPLVIIEQLLPAFQAVAFVFVILGAREMIKLYEHHKKYHFGVKLVIYIATVLTFIGGSTLLSSVIYGNPLYNLISISSFLVALSMQLSLLVFSKDFDASDIGKSIGTTLYVGFGVASLYTLRALGIEFISFLFLITIMTDVFAYVFGMLFGKHKMIERISPKKTWEGAIGGTLIGTFSATLLVFLFTDLFPNSDMNVVFGGILSGFGTNYVLLFVVVFAISLITSIFGQIGDLVASRLKRTYDVKDFSNIFPGHGGFLDRFDSSIVASAVLLALYFICSILVSL